MGLFMKLDGIPEPPEGYVPPLGSSRNTWTNIYKNKGRIDYCVQQFGVSCKFCFLSTAQCSAVFHPNLIVVIPTTLVDCGFSIISGCPFDLLRIYICGRM